MLSWLEMIVHANRLKNNETRKIAHTFTKRNFQTLLPNNFIFNNTMMIIVHAASAFAAGLTQINPVGSFKSKTTDKLLI